MITSMHIQNFKCFKDFTIDLGPFNVLIGPNDSGKTSFLNAIRLVSEVSLFHYHGWPAEELSARLGFPLGPEAVWRTDPFATTNVGVVARANGDQLPSAMSVKSENSSAGFIYWVEPEEIPGGGGKDLPLDSDSTEWQQWFSSAIGRPLYVRLVPNALRKPAPLNEGSLILSPDGEGFGAFLQDIWGAENGRTAFLALEQEFYRRFPEYKELIIEKRPLGNGRSGVGPALSFRTRHNERLSADSVSDGAILALAFLAICCNPSAPRVLLVEEPETGIHHTRLKEVIRTLRSLPEEKGVQVILTTHSPYLLDEVETNEVHVFQKDEEGAVHAKLLSEFEGAKEIGGMFGTGEKWSMLSEKFGI